MVLGIWTINQGSVPPIEIKFRTFNSYKVGMARELDLGLIITSQQPIIGPRPMHQDQARHGLRCTQEAQGP